MADSDNVGWIGWGIAGLKWAWDNKGEIFRNLRDLRAWYRGSAGTPESPGILIIGPGGAGKSTVGRLLSDDDYNPLWDVPGPYLESIGVESYKLSDASDVQLVVPRDKRTAGQRHGLICTRVSPLEPIGG